MTASVSTFGTIYPPPPTLPNSTDHASTRPRRYTVAGSSPQPQPQTGPSVRTPGGQSTTVVDQTRFPLGVKRYPFTFKLLLHKLYDLEDWAAKVHEVLATSQEQFRSLNSTPSGRSGSDSGSSGGIISDGVQRSPSSPGVTFTSPLFGTPSSPLESPSARRRRAQSILSKTKTNDNVSRSGPGPAGMTARPPPQPSRAVKRRIVNRRRSTERTWDRKVRGMDVRCCGVVY